MAVDYNGTTTKAEHTTASGVGTSLITIAFWINADSLGETSIGRILAIPEGGADFNLRWNAANQIRFARSHSTTNGVWLFTVNTGSWQAVCLTYDDTSTANDPAVRVNFAGVTVTESTAPVGTPTAPATGYCIGNLTDQSVTSDGGFAHFQLWNRILTTTEQDQALKFPGSVKSGLTLWLPFYDSTYNLDLATAGPWNPTFTAMAGRQPQPQLDDFWMPEQFDGPSELTKLGL